jgi:hypothetical protein
MGRAFSPDSYDFAFSWGVAPGWNDAAPLALNFNFRKGRTRNLPAPILDDDLVAYPSSEIVPWPRKKDAIDIVREMFRFSIIDSTNQIGASPGQSSVSIAERP